MEFATFPKQRDWPRQVRTAAWHIVQLPWATNLVHNALEQALQELRSLGWQVHERWVFPTQVMPEAVAIWAGQVIAEPGWQIRAVIRVRLLVNTPKNGKPTWCFDMMVGPEDQPAGAAEREGAREVPGCKQNILVRGGVRHLETQPLTKVLRLDIDNAVRDRLVQGIGSDVTQLCEWLMP